MSLINEPNFPRYYVRPLGIMLTTFYNFRRQTGTHIISYMTVGFRSILGWNVHYRNKEHAIHKHSLYKNPEKFRIYLHTKTILHKRLNNGCFFKLCKAIQWVTYAIRRARNMAGRFKLLLNKWKIFEYFFGSAILTDHNHNLPVAILFW